MASSKDARVHEPTDDCDGMRYRNRGYCACQNRASSLRHYHRDPRRYKNKQLLKAYGITIEDYEALLEAQGGVCAICKQPESALHQNGVVRRLAVDHDHETKIVRGLLCSGCNQGVGYFRNNPGLLDAAAAYLRAVDTLREIA
jgi:Recombination endonuclease VII